MIYLSPPLYDIKSLGRSYNASLNYTTISEDLVFFESEIKKKINFKGEVVALNSGTAAIHLALKLAGVSRGDYVLCQSFTFVACANPILYENAIPVFVDSERDTWNLCPDTLEIAINDLIKKGKKPKALIVVHLYGNPCEIERILAICLTYDIILIEDAAEALGSLVNGKSCGTFGHYGILSFNYNKIISAGGGGALLCKTKTEYDRAIFYATQAKNPLPYYSHTLSGYNYRMPHLQALLGINEIKHLSTRIALKKKVFMFYKKLFSQIPYVSVQPLSQPKAKKNYWLSTVLVESDSEDYFSNMHLYDALAKSSIESRPLWRPMHLQPLFKDALFYNTDVSKALFSKGLCLPSSPALNEIERNQIEKVIFDYFKL